MGERLLILIWMGESSASDLVGRASLFSNLDGGASPDTDLDERGKQLLATRFPDGTLNWRACR